MNHNPSKLPQTLLDLPEDDIWADSPVLPNLQTLRRPDTIAANPQQQQQLVQQRRSAILQEIQADPELFAALARVVGQNGQPVSPTTHQIDQLALYLNIAGIVIIAICGMATIATVAAKTPTSPDEKLVQITKENQRLAEMALKRKPTNYNCFAIVCPPQNQN
jgi:hypothetical protein